MANKIVVKKAKYIPVRMPVLAYNNYVKRQEKMEKVIKKITQKTTSVPLTKVFLISSEAPINLPDEYLLGITKKRKKI